MVRLICLLVLLAGPVAAECFGPPMPKVVRYGSALPIEILSHDAQDLTYRSPLPDGSPSVTTMRNGLFVLTESNHGTTYHYTWITPLPDLADLTPGFRGDYEADMVVEHASRSFFESRVEVLRAETVTLQGCDYPVLVVRRSDTLDGRGLAEVTMWLSPRLRIPLRTEALVAGQIQRHEVSALE